MSLGLFAAAVVLLEQHRFISVDRMAHLLGVGLADVLRMLTDMHAQGHCTLTRDAQGHVLSAAWRVQPKEPHPCD